jgi:ribosomal protein S11
MSRRDPTETQLDRLAELRASPPPRAELVVELRRLLAARSAHVVAKAARLAGEQQLAELLPELRSAFDQRMVDPVKRDPQCAAKSAIVNALLALEEVEPSVFLRGIRHVQREPVWGGTVDTAAELRGLCALGLAAAGHPGAALELARLLVDPETQARVLAARALTASGFVGTEELLRLKVHTGDEEREVLVEAMAGLLRVAPERSLAFAKELLAGDDASRAEAAALALGEARPEGAYEVLASALEAGQPEPSTTLLALATLRSQPAIELLLSVVVEGPGHLAREAMRALAAYREDEGLVERVREATERGSPEVAKAFRQHFG